MSFLILLACSFHHSRIHSFCHLSFIKQSLGERPALRKILKFLLTTCYVSQYTKYWILIVDLVQISLKGQNTTKDIVCLLFTSPVVVIDCQLKIVLSTLHSLNKKHIFSQCPLYIFPLGSPQLQIIWRWFKAKWISFWDSWGESDCLNKLSFWLDEIENVANVLEGNIMPADNEFMENWVP